MKANVGDTLVVMSRHLDEAVEQGEILEVHGANGDPPCMVHWEGNEHDSLLFPGPDAHVVPRKNTPAS